MSKVFGERLVFGQWLVHTGKLNPQLLQAALDIQNAERSDTLRKSSRLLGQILLDDFQVFRNRVELNQALVEFEKVKSLIEARKTTLNIHDQLPPMKKPERKTSPQVVSGHAGKPVADRAVFGQFLIEKRKINTALLERALAIQNMEAKQSLRSSHRLLGEILLDDFNIFSSRVELNRLLIEFNQFKAKLEAQRTDLMFLSRRTSSS